MLKTIEKIGNLRILRENVAPGCDGATFTLHAINGTDEVAHETYYTDDEKTAVERFMVHFDTYTLDMIRAGLPEIISEYDGRLLSGRLAGFSGLEYFKRIDDTRFYKHFDHRPMI